jgi:uncharacterized protein
MRCPACGKELTEKTVGGITVDVCDGGCGGIWFDQGELRRLDEADETAGEELLDVPRDPTLVIDQSKRLTCPNCGDVVMMRHYASVKREAMVDECPQCGGTWLDPGELRSIRTDYATEEAEEQAAGEYFEDVFSDDLAEEHEASQEDLERSRRVASAFKFICPSYYVPGKQGGGAF